MAQRQEHDRRTSLGWEAIAIAAVAMLTIALVAGAVWVLLDL